MSDSNIDERFAAAWRDHPGRPDLRTTVKLARLAVDGCRVRRELEALCETPHLWDDSLGEEPPVAVVSVRDIRHALDGE